MMDAVYGKIGGKVIPISYQYAEKTEQLRLYVPGPLFSYKNELIGMDIRLITKNPARLIHNAAT